MADDGYDPRFDPAFQRGFEGSAAPVERGEPVVEVAKLRHNPWIWALWGVAVVFTTAGVIGLIPVQASFGWVAERPDPVTAFILPALFHGLAPWFLGTGLAALIGVLIISAVRWRPRT
jgi:hypothetical protein